MLMQITISNIMAIMTRTETGLTLMIKTSTRDTMMTKEIGLILEITITIKTMTTTRATHNIKIIIKIITKMIKATSDNTRQRTN